MKFYVYSDLQCKTFALMLQWFIIMSQYFQCMNNVDQCNLKKSRDINVRCLHAYEQIQYLMDGIMRYILQGIGLIDYNEKQISNTVHVAVNWALGFTHKTI